MVKETFRDIKIDQIPVSKVISPLIHFMNKKLRKLCSYNVQTEELTKHQIFISINFDLKSLCRLPNNSLFVCENSSYFIVDEHLNIKIVEKIYFDLESASCDYLNGFVYVT